MMCQQRNSENGDRIAKSILHSRWFVIRYAPAPSCRTSRWFCFLVGCCTNKIQYNTQHPSPTGTVPSSPKLCWLLFSHHQASGIANAFSISSLHHIIRNQGKMTICSPSGTANRCLLLKLACIVASFRSSYSFVIQNSPQTSSLVGKKLDSKLWQLQLSTNDENNSIQDMTALEKEVWTSTQARLDRQRVSRLLDENTVQPREDSYSPFKVALSAGGVSALLAFGLFHNLTFSSLALIAVFFIANGDPLEEESVAGALARVLGRATIDSVEASQPKVRAVARAAVRGDEQYIELKAKMDELEQENKSLRLWKERRISVDANLNKFSFDELKDRARSSRLMVGGTKAQVLMRLVEANVIDLNEITYNNQNAYSASFDEDDFFDTNPQTSLANPRGTTTDSTGYPPNFYPMARGDSQ